MSDSDEEKEKLRLCIIGGGPAGLCTLRHVLSSTKSNVISVALFEQQSDIGGVWNYGGPEVKLWDSKGNPIVFAMYSDLRCNLPKQLMEFADFKHTVDPSVTFVTQQELHDYLIGYADKFNLWPYINVNQKIINVTPIAGKEVGRNLNNSTWLVTVEDTKFYQRRILEFDVIASCVGVNFVPKIPHIPGINHFTGDVLHSKYFKTAEPFKDKNVVLLGLGPSCADLSLKLATVAKTVTACHRYPGGFRLGLLPSSVRETSTIEGIHKRSVITKTGETIPCDVIIFCTGYKTQFPFLDTNGFDESVDDPLSNLPSMLYKRMFLPSQSSLCFINAHGFVSEFLVMEIQAKYLVAFLEGKVVLPSQTQMKKQAMHEELILSTQGKLTEALRNGCKSSMVEIEKYLKDLAMEGGFSSQFKHIPLNLAVWQLLIRRIFGSLAVYRQDQLRVMTPQFCECICAPNPKDNKFDKKPTAKLVTFQLCEDGTVVATEKNVENGVV